MFFFSTAGRYIARQFLVAFLAFFTLMIGLIVLFEFVEMIRRGASVEAVTPAVALQLTLLKVPELSQQLFHFAVLFSAMTTFAMMTRSRELVVIRASGVSAWQFIFPVAVVAVAIGFAKVGLLNPVGAAMFSEYRQLEARYFHNRESTLELSGGGIWLRQADPNGSSVIFAKDAEPANGRLRDVTVFVYDKQDVFKARVDAADAILRDGYWQLDEVLLTDRSEATRAISHFSLATELTPEKIEESFADPETISFWDLPAFIRTLEDNGFSTLRHRLYFNIELAQPLLMAAMVLFAAAFSVRRTARTGMLKLIVAGTVTGFLLFVATDIVRALGYSSSLPVALAAWSPTMVSLFLSTGMLLHLEDG